MKKKFFTKKEWVYYVVRMFCNILVILPAKIGNWATDKLNKSYYKTPNKN